jgi:hypothetical protein
MKLAQNYVQWWVSVLGVLHLRVLYYQRISSYLSNFQRKITNECTIRTNLNLAAIPTDQQNGEVTYTTVTILH